MGKKMKADDGSRKKHSKHNPQAESVKAVFGEPKAKPYDPTDLKHEQINICSCFLLIYLRIIILN